MREERTPVVHLPQPRSSTKELTFKNFQCLRDSKTQEPFKDQRNSSKILNTAEIEDKENRSHNVMSPEPFNPTKPSPQLKRQPTIEQKSEEKRSILGEQINEALRVSFGLDASTARKSQKVSKPLMPPEHSQSIVFTKTTRSETVSPYHRVRPAPSTARGAIHRKLNDSISEKVKECEQFQKHVHELMTIRNKQTIDLLTGHTPRSFEFTTDKLNISALERRLPTDFVEYDSSEKISHSFVGFKPHNSLLSSQRSSKEDVPLKRYPVTGRLNASRPPSGVSPHAGFAIIHAPEPPKREAVAKQLLKRRSVEKVEEIKQEPKPEKKEEKIEIPSKKELEEVKSFIQESKPPRRRE